MDWQHTNFKIFCFFWSIKHGCWNDIYNIDYKYICKDSKNKGPSSLRSMVPCHPDQAQTIEFVERGKIKSRCNSKQSPSLRSWSLSNRLLWMKQQLGIKSTLSKSEGQLSVLSVVQVYIKLLFFLFPVLRAFSRFLSNLLGVPFLLYSLSKHPNPPLVSQRAFPNILISSGLCWRWQKGLLAVELLFRGHFHINATDKVGVGRWMRRWKVCPLGKFLPPSLFPLVSFRKIPPTILVPISVLSPLLGPSQDTNCPNSTSILEWAKSSEFIYLFGLGQCKLFRGLILLYSWTPHKNNYQYSITEKNSWKGEGKKKWKEFLVMVLVAGKKHWEKN